MEPSLKVAVRVKADPEANRLPPVSEAKRTALPPGARVKLTESLEVFRREPSSEVATPKDPRAAAPHRIPDAAPRALEFQPGDRAGAGAAEGHQKRAIQEAVRRTGAIAHADPIADFASEGQGQRGGGGGRHGGGGRGGGAIAEGGGKGKGRPGGEQAPGIGSEEDGAAARGQGEVDRIAGGVQERAVERGGDTQGSTRCCSPPYPRRRPPCAGVPAG